LTAAENSALVVIPARFASTRLPGKPVLDATGKPLIQHVWEQAARIRSAAAVVVATDDERILDAVHRFGGQAVMTSPGCASGSDRVAEVAATRTEPIVVNLQGDEPDFEPADVDALVRAMIAEPSLPMGTLAVEAEDDERDSPSVVKVVCDRAGNALYFSRARVPHERDPDPSRPAASVRRHLGIYAFRRASLLDFAGLAPTALERTEKLEQLRALEHGWRIRVVPATRAPRGIDTPEDYEAFRCRVAAQSGDEG
jgi:3-deoxy-manno-octulosonate cytidylyltransferase (CMP-KDO synthetase)